MGEPPEIEIVEPAEDEDPHVAHTQAVLRGLRGGGMIDVFRRKPTWCSGYLTTIELQADEELDLRQLKADWGGGELQLRPKQLTPSGVKYARGGGTIRLSGAPRENGVPLAESSTTPPTVVIEKNAPARPAGDASLAQVLGMVMQQQTALMQLLIARSEPPPPPPVAPTPGGDMLAQLRGLLAVHREIQKITGGDEDEEPTTPAAGGGDRLVELMLRKLEGKLDQPAAPTAPPPGWRLHKSAAAPAASAAPSAAPSTPAPSDMLQALRALPTAQRMELLGELAQELDPATITQWMTQEYGGKVGT